MTMKIIKCKHFPPKGYDAMMVVWWLFVKEGYQITSRLINHEEIHSIQQKEMLVLPFFIWYGIEFLFRLIQYRNWNEAYMNLSFEREAYSNQYDIAYLSKRKHFAWIHFINNKH